MPESWNAEVYRERARQWHAAAEQLPSGKERDACLTLSDGYARLAELIDCSGLGSLSAPEHSPTS